jgi:GNAT superfamily N-acetyltransferase
MSITYRLADVKDSRELKRLNDEFNGVDANTLEGIEEGLAREDAETVFVAEEDGRLVGFCCCQLLKSICYSVFYVEITEVYIEEAKQRSGVGRGIITYAEEWYRQRNIHDFQLFTGESNLNAQNFYSHIGYRKFNDILYRKRDWWNNK